MEELSGAMLAGLIDWALEDAWHKQGKPRKFPWVEINPRIPPVDDLIVGIVSLLMYSYGKITEVREIEKMGKGAIAYSLGMLLHHTLLRNLTYRRG